MNPKVIIPMVIIILGVGGFFTYQNFSQSGEPAAEIEEEIGVTPGGTLSKEASAGETSTEGTPFIKETSVPAGESSAPLKEEQIAMTPVDVLSEGLINKWGVNCKNKGNVLDIANCILDWQENNIFWCYTNPQAQSYFDYFHPDYPDCVVDMQFQQMVPNSFPVSKIMDVKVRDGKIFGACYTYATTYCAIARWNGLTCRVMEAKTTILFYLASSGDYASGYCGSVPKNFLVKLGYSCDDWRQKNWTMDADHYWAEVLINGQWKLMERPTWAYQHDTTKYIIQAGRTYVDTGW